MLEVGMGGKQLTGTLTSFVLIKPLVSEGDGTRRSQ